MRRHAIARRARRDRHRRQGHHRHARSADADGVDGVRGTPQRTRRRMRRATARRGRLCVRQDGDDRAGVHASGQDAQSVERCAYARRIVVGVGSGGRGGSRRGRPRHADQRLRDSSRCVLRHRRLQAVGGRDSICGSQRVQRDARHAGHVHAQRARCSAARRRARRARRDRAIQIRSSRRRSPCCHSFHGRRSTPRRARRLRPPVEASKRAVHTS